MASFVQIDENNIVVKVIVATAQFIRSGAVGDPKKWLEYTPYSETRKRYPGTGWFYDPDEDDFFPPKPYPSWVWINDPYGDGEYWSPPIPFPGTPENGLAFEWDEESKSWVPVAGHFDEELQRFVPD